MWQKVYAVGNTRWDPETRAGAIAVRPKGKMDVQAVRAVSAAVNDWARYQNLDGEADNVETSSVRGTYDWRSYLQEETSFARRREARARKAEPRAAPEPAPAPQNLYA